MTWEEWTGAAAIVILLLCGLALLAIRYGSEIQ
jgi:hypothetical protein